MFRIFDKKQIYPKDLKKKIFTKFNSLLKHILQKPSLYLFAFLIIFSIDRHHRWEFGKEPNPGPFYDDVEQYYSFLPDIFLKHNDDAAKKLQKAKVTLGMAVMYSPAFFIGHILAHTTGQNEDGYSEPYQKTFRWENIFICILGIWFCRKSLLYFFNEIVVTISLVSIYFGTNLFIYTYSLAGMPHTYLFFLFSVFIFFTLKWILENKSSYLLALFFIGGMIVLTRPSDIIVFLFPLLFNVSGWKDFINRIKLFFSKPLITFLSILLFFIPILFQMLIWKKYVGEFLHYSYGNERFFFNDPQVINFLFSFRKGWLVYTPIMLFSLVGIIISAKKLKSFFPFLVLFFCLNVYILSSWWDWYYGGSFGCRALIQSYAFMIFPFSVFVSWIWELKLLNYIVKYAIRFLFIAVLFLFIKLNIFQSWQYRFQIIHWNGMNKEAYRFVFFKEHLTKDEMSHLQTIITPPKWEMLINGERD